MPTTITYNIREDYYGKLEKAAITSCEFWNSALIPKFSHVIHLSVKEFSSNTALAAAHRPFSKEGVVYGKVGFSKNWLEDADEDQLDFVAIHEIAHTLGFGWERWKRFFCAKSGLFQSHAVAAVPALANMSVELNGGSGTRLMHWSEEPLQHEIMTGWLSANPVVSPTTINVMELLGHNSRNTLTETTELKEIIDQIRGSGHNFSDQGLAASIDRTHYEETEVLEIYERSPYEPTAIMSYSSF